MTFTLQVLFAIVVSLALTGCEIIGGIFEAGVWVGIILVVGVIALGVFLIKKLF